MAISVSRLNPIKNLWSEPKRGGGVPKDINDSEVLHGGIVKNHSKSVGTPVHLLIHVII